ncbi:hypothetical protein DFA_03701 [Cavenderia fasciculata]|uniref:Uncharacterized protein n=1 Tax=Cavenderia fasciculata TaxID=261658 RepID=F4Q1R4_CACFS|nr:uncharacterized protein DFA_03701 [Cavenderia fasciculata]EGG18214.1 hypothetical protein DFA_03701 [Cavenderia fasciculata]|eukprot:XP_004357037.1 hypothetical protein DFA_03701 [Cavenderia fasciculata]
MTIIDFCINVVYLFIYLSLLSFTQTINISVISALLLLNNKHAWLSCSLKKSCRGMSRQPGAIADAKDIDSKTDPSISASSLITLSLSCSQQQPH